MMIKCHFSSEGNRRSNNYEDYLTGNIPCSHFTHSIGLRGEKDTRVNDNDNSRTQNRNRSVPSVIIITSSISLISISPLAKVHFNLRLQYLIDTFAAACNVS